MHFYDNNHKILIFVSVLFSFALTLPILILFVNDISLAGAIEETIGARYFYTLRNLYGGEQPWVPQGHFVGLFHYCIQLFLSASGYPPDEMFPRVDIFIFLATITPHIISGVCFYWAVQPIRATSSRILVAALAIMIGYSSSLSYGIGVKNESTEMIWWLTLPDYLAWALPYALIMMGAVLRVVTNFNYQGMTRRVAVWLGIFSGITMATKITLLSFPFAIASVILFQEQKWRRALYFLLGITFPVFVLTGSALILTYLFWDIPAMLSSFKTLAGWLLGEKARVHAYHLSQGHDLYSLSFWWVVLQPKNWTDILYFPVIVLLAIILTGVNKNHRFLLALVPACLLVIYVCMNRFYHVTWVEYLFFFFAIFVIWCVTVFSDTGATTIIGNSPTKHLRESSRLIVLSMPYFRLILSLFLILTVYPGAVDKFNELRKFSEESNASSKELNLLLNELGGRTVFLSAGGNNYRIRSIHSAICKGGIDTFVPMWGQSKYIEAMFPNMGCFFRQSPQDLTPYNNAVLIQLKGIKDTREAVFRRAENSFSFSMYSFDCSREVDFPDSIAIVCVL